MGKIRDVIEGMNREGLQTTKQRGLSNPQRALGVAVIARALDDFQAKPPDDKGQKSFKSMHGEWIKNRNTAREFLFTKNTAFGFWCALAGIDATYLHEKIVGELG